MQMCGCADEKAAVKAPLSLRAAAGRGERRGGVAISEDSPQCKAVMLSRRLPRFARNDKAVNGFKLLNPFSSTKNDEILLLFHQIKMNICLT
ncbi:hypothetical protein BC343_18275 [Mucilaginibacter pedocola]|uniref:Uncharacterized protein n=1 Tax=Mucilaginibacter pedocola TaxID=1792845 RepID=A0A1S9P627_9SPHI|nr:hypothetical protein BC343_18275 [Mucilaginibacter pedocola]